VAAAGAGCRRCRARCCCLAACQQRKQLILLLLGLLLRAGLLLLLLKRELPLRRVELLLQGVACEWWW
jgi:hypothetical protein